jgi:hypothetical protein
MMGYAPQITRHPLPNNNSRSHGAALNATATDTSRGTFHDANEPHTQVYS